MEANTVDVISTATNAIIDTIAVGTHPCGISGSPDGSKVYVGNYLDNTVSVINTAVDTASLLDYWGTGPEGISVSPDGKRVYVANYMDDNVSVINTVTNTSLGEITVGSYPDGVSVNSDGSKIYVANYGSNTISVIDSGSYTASAIAVGHGPNAFGNFISYHTQPVGFASQSIVSANIGLYPNPANDNITIECPQAAVIEITNIQGQLIKTFATTGNNTIIDISALHVGVYVVKMKTEKGVEVKKFIKE
jgi:YVTN family beta-propeller protein